MSLIDIILGHEKRELTLEAAMDFIIKYNEKIGEFWSNASGWASQSVADLLGKSRLDWQVSLSHTLKDWINIPDENDPKHEGRLILAWANLGSLVENSLKFFLSVYLEDYRVGEPILVRGRATDPDEAAFEKLRIFFRDNIWVDCNKIIRDEYILKIQQRRNAIHAYKNRDIGDYEELHNAIFDYLEMLKELEQRVPYPDDHFYH